MAELVVQGLTKKFGDVKAVDDVSFVIADGEFLSLLGPSGCGKTTTLGAVAGLDRPDEGLIRAGSTVFSDSATNTFLPPEARNTGLVFQSYALWPHLTVEQNVSFGLKLRKVPKALMRKQVHETLDLVEMAAYAARYPHELSGGQQQRVALARTLVYQPSVLLLDEPLSNLDAKLRERARAWLSELQNRIRLTTLYVTHDQAEALALSDRIAVMNNGKIVQLGTPQEVYQTPADPFVADFIGTTNFFPGHIRGTSHDGGELTIELNGGEKILVKSARSFSRSSVTVAVRPEIIRLYAPRDAPAAGSGTLLPATVTSRAYLGTCWHYHVAIGDIQARTESREELSGDVRVWVPSEGCVVFQTAA